MKLSKLLFTLLVSSLTLSYAQKVDANFRNLEIKDFLTMIGKITGKNILVDGEVSGKVNFVSNKPIEKSEFIPLANAILGSKGLTLVNKGSYYQVVKSGEAAGSGLPVSTKVDGGNGGMKTVIFRLRKDNAAVLRTKIQPLLSKDDKVTSFEKNNLLAVTAHPSTLKSVKKLIDNLEAQESKKSRVVKLKRAKAKDVYANAQAMSKSLFAQDIDSEKVEIMQDPSSNSLIIIGNRENSNKMERYIRDLDIKGANTTQRMYVIELHNSNVEDMEKILSKILPQMQDSSGNAYSAPVAVANAVGATSTTSSSSPTSTESLKAVIAADLERNALIVLATPEQIINIRQTVDQLDIEKSQVFIQARIVEVNTNLAENIGFKYGFNGGAITSKGLFSLMGNAGAAPLAISSELLGFLNSSTTTTTSTATTTSSSRAFEFSSGIKEVFALGAQLNLLKENGAAQILSTPSILCTNNKESSIYVGRTQSILTQSQQSTQGTSNVLNNYSREDIGITLKVKPRLSSGNKVSLEVETKIEDVLPGSATSDRPTTTKRAVKTSAIVNNAETIILGGLIKTADGKSVTKVPLLGDIPILGELFTSRGESNVKENVVIYLTPYIVHSSSDLTQLRKNLDELEAVQQEYNNIVMNQLETHKEQKKSEVGHSTFGASSKEAKPLIQSDELSQEPRGFEDKEIEEKIVPSYLDKPSNDPYTPVEKKKITPAKKNKKNSSNELDTQENSSESKPQILALDMTQKTLQFQPLDSISDKTKSESVLEELEAQKAQKVNLQKIDTGIEYNEATTFVKAPPSSNPEVQNIDENSQKNYFSIQVASATTKDGVRQSLSKMPKDILSKVRVVRLDDGYKALVELDPSYNDAKRHLARYKRVVPDAFIKATTPSQEIIQ